MGKKNMKLIRCLAFLLMVAMIFTNNSGIAMAASYSDDIVEESVVSGVAPTLHNPVKEEDGSVTYDSVYFGSYWQEDTNGDGKANYMDDVTPLQWRVLSVNGDDVFLLCDKTINYANYNISDIDITWENSTLRCWLNGYIDEYNEATVPYANNFLQNAFTKQEQEIISETVVRHSDSKADSSISGGNDTIDKIFCLSVEEATNPKYGFNPSLTEYDSARFIKATPYAEAQGVTAYRVETPHSEWIGNTVTWLRTPGKEANKVAVMHAWGYIYSDGFGVYNLESKTFPGVLPAMHIDLSKVTWGENIDVAPSINTNKGNSNKPTTPSAPKKNADGTVTYDKIYFGYYWQNDTNKDGKIDRSDDREPIQWRVLAVEDDKALLWAEKGLDAKAYHGKKEAVTWEKSDIRSWLATNFLKDAFPEKADADILETTIVNADNARFKVDGGADTKDKVFLLSLADTVNTDYGFDSKFETEDAARIVDVTAYAKQQGADIFDGHGYTGLRSPGSATTDSAYINNNGYVSEAGMPVTDVTMAIRPAIYIDLVSASWSFKEPDAIKGAPDDSSNPKDDDPENPENVTITFDEAGGKGSISVNGTLVKNGKVSVSQNETVSVNVVPEKGYIVSKVVLNGKDIDAKSEFSFKAEKDSLIEITYVEDTNPVMVSVSVNEIDGKGAITIDGKKLTESAFSVSINSTVSINIVPEDSYMVDTVLFNNSKLGAKTDLEIKITKDSVLNIVYTKVQEDAFALLVKEKYDIKPLFGELGGVPTKYRLETELGAVSKIATITKKGILTAKKPGVVYVVPFVNGAFLYTKKLEVKIITTDIIADKLLMVEGGQAIKTAPLIDLPKNQSIIWSVTNPNNPVVNVEYDNKGNVKSISAIRTGSVKLKAIVTYGNNQTLKITKTVKVKLPKLSVKDSVLVASGKSKAVSVTNILKDATVEWTTNVPNTVYIEKNAKTTAKVKLHISGNPGDKATVTATVTEFVDGKKHTIPYMFEVVVK